MERPRFFEIIPSVGFGPMWASAPTFFFEVVHEILLEQLSCPENLLAEAAAYASQTLVGHVVSTEDSTLTLTLGTMEEPEDAPAENRTSRRTGTFTGRTPPCWPPTARTAPSTTTATPSTLADGTVLNG